MIFLLFMIIKKLLRKILIADLPEESLGHNVLCHQWQNAADIWNNQNNGKSDSIGVERILKLVLILSQFFFLGIYFRAIFGKYGKLHKHLGVELHVVLKLISSITILYFGIYNSTTSIYGVHIIKFWCYWMIFETLFYTGNLVFSEEVFAKPYSNKRNLILIVIDYITLNLDFANLYLIKRAIHQSLHRDTIEIVSNAYDAVYFSFISSLTIGYGDITPTHEGRSLVVFQSITMLVFGVLFLNFYLSRANDSIGSRK
ncbi:MAG: two pore domain potassium channel family protein [Bacteroidetes bacterium]|nr:two pore domain potassium channel family protein [Bacteroidota bacterium]